ncbi:MAG: hypothetical protein KDB88_14140 [Flavobacteriales bacterium]|nr:hypothetical protein [Flavobacteriales bacterium]
MERAISVLFLFRLILIGLLAQDLAPFMERDGRTMIFDRGSFEELEGLQVEDRVVVPGTAVFRTAAGEVVLYRTGKLRRIAGPGEAQLLPMGRDVCAIVNDSLWCLHGAEFQLLASRVDTVEAADSMAVFVDAEDRGLYVAWRGGLTRMAEVNGAGAPEWAMGGNTVVVHGGGTGLANLFHRGNVLPLAASNEGFRVSCGMDVVAYTGTNKGPFMIWTPHGHTEIVPDPPSRFLAANELVAFVEGDERLLIWVHDTVHVVGEAPTDMWSEGGLLLWIEGGKLHTWTNHGPMAVTPYVPEKWSVSQGTIYYLDLDRQIWSFRDGSRSPISSELGIPDFEVFPGTVLYRNQQGAVRVHWNGRLHTYY